MMCCVSRIMYAASSCRGEGTLGGGTNRGTRGGHEAGTHNCSIFRLISSACTSALSNSLLLVFCACGYTDDKPQGSSRDKQASRARIRTRTPASVFVTTTLPSLCLRDSPCPHDARIPELGPTSRPRPCALLCDAFSLRLHRVPLPRATRDGTLDETEYSRATGSGAALAQHGCSRWCDEREPLLHSGCEEFTFASRSCRTALRGKSLT